MLSDLEFCRRRQPVDPCPPHVGKCRQPVDPSPLGTADILNGWPLIEICFEFLRLISVLDTVFRDLSRTFSEALSFGPR